jgi:phosphonate transport system permease protein
MQALVVSDAHIHRFDPDARKRATGLLLALLVAWPLLVWSQFHPAALFDARNLATMARFLAGFVPPETSADFLAELGRATLETLAIATAGMTLAFVIAVPLTLVATRSLSIARLGPGPGLNASRALYALCRLLLVSLRGIPELVWALLFVRAFGLGPAAGVLALAVTYGGMLAKVYTEILESAEAEPVRVLLEAGAPRTLALLYGLLPIAAQEIVSYTVYRWECALRASVVMGFVGAGGLGQLMDQSMKMMNGGEAAMILIAFLVLVLLADWISAGLRKQLA